MFCWIITLTDERINRNWVLKKKSRLERHISTRKSTAPSPDESLVLTEAERRQKWGHRWGSRISSWCRRTGHQRSGQRGNTHVQNHLQNPGLCAKDKSRHLAAAGVGSSHTSTYYPNDYILRFSSCDWSFVLKTAKEGGGSLLDTHTRTHISHNDFNQKGKRLISHHQAVTNVRN